jgi:hypothetical protein
MFVVSDFGSQTIVDTFRGFDEVISLLLLLTSRSCIKYGEKVTFPSSLFSEERKKEKNNFDFSQLPSSFEHVERSCCLCRARHPRKEEKKGAVVVYRERTAAQETDKKKNNVENEHSRFVALSGHVSTRLLSIQSTCLVVNMNE